MRLKICLTLLLLLNLLSAGPIDNGLFQPTPNDSTGVWSFAGESKLLWGQFLYHDDIYNYIGDAIPYKIPSDWNSIEGKPPGGHGFGTILVQVKLPDEMVGREFSIKIPTIQTSYTLFYNDRHLISVGKPCSTESSTSPEYRPTTVYLGPVDSSFDLIFHVANFSDRRGGMWEPIFIGFTEQIERKKTMSVAYELFSASILFVLAVYYLFVVVMLKRTDESAQIIRLFIFVITICIRTLVRGHRLLLTFIPETDFETIMTLDYVTFFIGSASFQSYVAVSYKRWCGVYYNAFFQTVSFIFLLLSLVTPLAFHSYLVAPYQVLILTAFVSYYFVVFKTYKTNFTHALTLFINATIFTLAVGHDILADHSRVGTTQMIPAAGVLVAFFQTIAIISQHVELNKTNSLITERLKRVNSALTRFVPCEFFKILKISATDISLGDHIKQTMSVLFCDIRNFTSLTENMTPEECFSFVNSYIELVGPHIMENGGYVDKYLGDGILALFNDNPQGALRSAQAIERAVRHSNLGELTKGGEEVKIGIGLHYGSLVLGVVGTADRFDDTAIGAVVNTTFRLDDLCKSYGTSLIASEDFLSVVSIDPNWIRRLGNVEVKGLKVAIAVYEIFDSYSYANRPELSGRYRDSFDEAVTLYNEGLYKQALKIFEQLYSEIPSDRACELFIRNCRLKRFSMFVDD